MDLMWIIYWLGFIGTLNDLLRTTIIVGLFGGILFVIFGAMVYSDGAITKTTYSNIIKLIFKIIGFAGVTLLVIPSEKTAYMMVGANISQSVATTIANDPRTQQLTEKVFKTVNKQLDIYLEEDSK